VHTGFIDEQFDTLFPPIIISPQQVSQAALALVLNELQAAFRNGNKDQDPFVATPNARLNYSLVRRYDLKANEKGKPHI